MQRKEKHTKTRSLKTLLACDLTEIKKAIQEAKEAGVKLTEEQIESLKGKPFLNGELDNKVQQMIELH